MLEKKEANILVLGDAGYLLSSCWPGSVISAGTAVSTNEQLESSIMKEERTEHDWSWSNGLWYISML